MALTYPRDMITPHCWRRADFRLLEGVEIARAPSGTQFADLRPAVWRATFESVPLRRAGARSLHAVFQNLGARSFYAYPYRDRTPAAHDGSSFVGALQGILGGGAVIAIQDLPAGYTLTAGDYVSVSHAAGKHSLHQIAVTATDGDNNGLISQIDIHPPLHPEAEIGDDANLLSPLVEMVLVPETLDLFRLSEQFWAVAFDAEEVRT